MLFYSKTRIELQWKEITILESNASLEANYATEAELLSKTGNQASSRKWSN